MSYILGTIFFTILGQLILKWQIAKYGVFPELLNEKLLFLIKLFINPYILVSFISAFLASLCWMAAMTKYELSYAFPFMSFNYVLVLLFSSIFFNEDINITKVLGSILIVLGIIVISIGQKDGTNH